MTSVLFGTVYHPKLQQKVGHDVLGKQFPAELLRNIFRQNGIKAEAVRVSEYRARLDSSQTNSLQRDKLEQLPQDDFVVLTGPDLNPSAEQIPEPDAKQEERVYNLYMSLFESASKAVSDGLASIFTRLGPPPHSTER